MGLKPFSVNPHKEDLGDKVLEYNKSKEQVADKKQAIMKTLEKENIKMAKAI